MPFDKSRKFGQSSNPGIARQDGKWYRISDGKETDEDGNLKGADTPAAKAAETLAQRNDAKAAKTRAEREGTNEEASETAFEERLADLKGLKVPKLKSMAKDVMAALDEDGAEYEAPRMSGAGVGNVLKEFIARNTG